jgi:NADPH:quinone reductase-like Zn-dependent oxidoreductase
MYTFVRYTKKLKSNNHVLEERSTNVLLFQGQYPGVTYDSILGGDGAGQVVKCGDETDNGAFLGKKVVINPTVGWDEQTTFPERIMEFGILGLLPLPGM